MSIITGAFAEPGCPCAPVKTTHATATIARVDPMLLNEGDELHHAR